MVQLSIQVRTKTCYCKAGNIKTVSVDSSQRIEEIVQKGSRLYRDGRELPLNSSFASNNVQNGDILETCSSPLMSALLSAVLQDFNVIENVPEYERTKETIEPLLGGAKLDPWPNRWSFDSMKTRKICLAMMKKVLQRDDRFEHEMVPKIATLQELYNFMQTIWNKSKSSTNAMAHVFKPSAKNAQGNPSTCWQMMEHKFINAQRIRRACATIGVDWIEAFVQAENRRHGTTATPSRRPRNRRTANGKITQQIRRTLPTPEPLKSRRGSAATSIKCSTCTQLAECTCLEADCPFHQHFSCLRCFMGNHPIQIRNHTRISLTDARVKPILKEKNRKGYCPEFQSGPFAILCSLLEAQMEQNSGQRELSLSESRLKKLAQKRCRSNLYDRQARGRSAFACIEGMANKQLVRKELIPGREEARFSLMPEGEAMAQRCYDFERMTEQVLKENTLTRLQDSCPKSLTLLVDTREDTTYSNRLQEHFIDQGYPCEPRELPAGDYLFLKNTPGDDKETVLPLVIERKSWSDFADSVKGAGKGHRRLDCVKMGGSGQCSNGRCQLCRMKRSGCKQVMFIIEGARCVNRDGEYDKCGETNRCQHCRELEDRHNIVQEELESIIYDLQATHGCLVHFTRDYNDTIQSLKMIYRILVSIQSVQSDDESQRANQLSLKASAAPSPSSDSPKLSYKEFMSNAKKHRKRPHIKSGKERKDLKRLEVETFIRGIRDDCLLRTLSSLPKTTSESTAQKDLNPLFRAAAKTAIDPTVEIIESDSDNEIGGIAEFQDSVEILEFGPGICTSRAPPAVECIDINSDDDRKPAANPNKRSYDDDIVVFGEDSTVEHCNEASSKGVSKYGIFVILGLYEYDREFFKDINKIWQNMYQSQPSASQETFRKGVLDKLRLIQNDQLPLVHRDSILYWTLRIPLCEKVLLHTARTAKCLQDLTSRWDEERPSPRSDGRIVGNSQPNQEVQVAGKRPQGRERGRTLGGRQEEDEVVILDDDRVAGTFPRDLFNNCPTPVVDNPKSRNMRQEMQQAIRIYTIDDDEPILLDTATPGSTNRSIVRNTTQREDRKRLIHEVKRGRSPLTARKATSIHAMDSQIGEKSSGSGRKRSALHDIEFVGTSRQRQIKESTPTQAARIVARSTQQGGRGNASQSERVEVQHLATRKSPPKNDVKTTTSTNPNFTSRKMQPDPVHSKTDIKIRQARLRRFVAAEVTGGDNSKWICRLCTYTNDLYVEECKICGATAGITKTPDQRMGSGRESRAQGPTPSSRWNIAASVCKKQSPPCTPTTWSCPKCTYNNALHASSCRMCDYASLSHTFERPASGTKVLSSATKLDGNRRPPISPKRRIRCGACGLDGHNRGTATVYNCPAYNKPEEVEMRAKKKEAAQKKAKDFKEDFEDYQSRKEAREAARAQRMEELQRLITQQQQDIEEDQRNSENELKRRRKAAERAEKRARRLDT